MVTERDEVLARATELGADAGRAAASWVFDGNTSDATYREVLRGLEDIDPMILDQFNVPNLSGEYADDPTPASLAEDLDLDPEADEDLLEEACQVWEDLASAAFWEEVERVARLHTETEED